MGEDNYQFSSAQSTSSYSNTYPVKIEEQIEIEEMVPYQLGNSETYCPEQKIMETVGEKAFQEEMLDEYHERPHLHHMPSISTTCTSDSFSLTSADAEVSAFDLNASESQDFDWSINSSSHFQWPPNRIFPLNRANSDNLATPPLDSPVNFHQLGYSGHITPQHERRLSFSSGLPNYYPTANRRPSLTTFQPYTAPQMVHSRSSGANSRSITPTIQSPSLANPPRPTKKGSISTDIPTGRNRGQSLQSLNSELSVDTISSVNTTTGSRRRSSLSASQHHLSRSPNRVHQRRASGLPTAPPAYALPLSQDLFDDKTQTGRMQIKRSKSANTILVNHQPPPPPPQDYTTMEGTVEESSGDDGPLRPDDLAKTKAARAQSEHRRRVELKESFERLRLTLGVPQPRAGKKDLVEQAIAALEYFRRKESEMMQEIQFLRQGQQIKTYASPLCCGLYLIVDGRVRR
jgi:hypothetical protein